MDDGFKVHTKNLILSSHFKNYTYMVPQYFFQFNLGAKVHFCYFLVPCLGKGRERSLDSSNRERKMLLTPISTTKRVNFCVNFVQVGIMFFQLKQYVLVSEHFSVLF